MTSRNKRGLNSYMEIVKIVECPRDAWQGLPQIIPTEVKADYLRMLVETGFRHIDAVSFVSPKHVAQMADSEAVMEQFCASLPSGSTPPEIIGIVVTDPGVERARATRGVTTLGYPYSISAYVPARERKYVPHGIAHASRANKESYYEDAGRDLVVYISMAFGNPYDEPWGPERSSKKRCTG